MTIFEVTKENYTELPRESDIKEFDSVLIIPTDEIHDSGYACMAFVGCVGNEAICVKGGGADVIHVDGIGGYGKRDRRKPIPEYVRPKMWSIDCTPNGLLRLFAHRKLTFENEFLSDCDVYAD